MHTLCHPFARTLVRVNTDEVAKPTFEHFVAKSGPALLTRRNLFKYAVTLVS
jgi:hypothetical protein